MSGMGTTKDTTETCTTMTTASAKILPQSCKWVTGVMWNIESFKMLMVKRIVAGWIYISS